MKVQVIVYDANKPIPRQIVVPTNSEYAIGIKVTKDGNVIDNGLTVGGVEPTNTIGDYSIFYLSSDSTEGMKQFELEVNGLQAKFPLYVMEKDLGYFEK